MTLKLLSASSLLLTMFMMAAPASASFFNPQSSRAMAFSEKEIRNDILDEFDRWKGVRYRFGGTTFRGIDCSALMQKIFHAAFEDKPHVRLPRTTGQQLKKGVQASRHDLRPGDLVFFRISSGRHVGVYIGDEKFVHASTSKGVIISTLENRYWDKRFTSARRIIG